MIILWSIHQYVVVVKKNFIFLIGDGTTFNNIQRRLQTRRESSLTAWRDHSPFDIKWEINCCCLSMFLLFVRKDLWLLSSFLWRALSSLSSLLFSLLPIESERSSLANIWTFLYQQHGWSINLCTTYNGRWITFVYYGWQVTRKKNSSCPSTC